MFDDVFLQYDEGRAKQGLKFLVDYTKRDDILTQIIMFTCQKSIIDLAKKIILANSLYKSHLAHLKLLLLLNLPS